MTDVPIHSDDTRGRIGGIIASFGTKRRAEFDRLVAGGMKPSVAAERVLDQMQVEVNRRLGR